MSDQSRVSSADKARWSPESAQSAHKHAPATQATKRGGLDGAVPVPQAAKLTELRGSARGCYGDATAFVEQVRGEWD